MPAKPVRGSTPPCNGSSRSCWLPALIWTICALALTSCATGTHRTPAEPLPAALLALLSPVPAVEQALTSPCPPELPAAPDDRVPTLLRNHDESAAIYHACKDGKASLAAAARERERIEAERIERARAAMLGMRK